ncbi:MAG: hypothetical protein HYY93_04630 [Planctomycetes bacterium]|nr:hypothetical protein [Planctomycetota bacterium]
MSLHRLFVWFAAFALLAPLLTAQETPGTPAPPDPDESILIDEPKGASGSPAADPLVNDALGWLARHQEADGSWSSKEYLRRCLSERACATAEWDGASPDEHRAGLTGLALLAFLEAGTTPASTVDFPRPGGVIRSGACVQKAVDWLRQSQDADGCIGGQKTAKYMYDAAIGTCALSEYAAATKDPAALGAAQRAADFLCSAQNPGKGWRYTKRCGDNDTSVTGWCVLALKAAEQAGCKVPGAAFEGAAGWFDEVTDPNYFKVGYTTRGTGQVVTTENMDYANHPALEALAVTCRLLMGQNIDAAPIAQAVGPVVSDFPSWDMSKKSTDFYYWFWGTRAFQLYDAPTGPGWANWAIPLKAALVSHQIKPEKPGLSASCDTGSWPPVGRWCFEGGRVYSTAINCLTLVTLLKNGVPEEVPVAAPQGAGAPPAVAAETSVQERLSRQKVSLDFLDTPPADVLDFLSEISGCNFVLDPVAAEEVQDKVSLKVRDLPLDKALKLLLTPLGLDFLAEDGIVYISDETGLNSYRTRRIESKLNSLNVTLNFQSAPLSEVISFLNDFSEVSFIFDSSVPDSTQERQVTLQIRNASLRDTLSALMRTVGCRFEVQPATVVIVQATALAPDSSQPVRRAYSLARLGIGLEPTAVIGLIGKVEPSLAGKVQFDEPTGCLVIEAPESVHASVMSTLRELAGTRKEK